MTSPFDSFWHTCLTDLAAAGRCRSLRVVERLEGAEAVIDGRRLIDFSSNDYLGLSRHPLLVERACRYAAQWGAGSAASRLVRGNLAPFVLLEKRIAAAKGCEAALILASGFQANAAVLPALLDAKVLGAEPVVLADRLIHASMYHGIAAAGLRPTRFRHNDLDHLGELLARHAGRPCVVVTESVFSMDGDRADVPALVGLCERHGALLYIDEAHATGVLGETGFGLAAGYGGRIGVVMGTFSKGLGSFGAYVAGSRALCDYLVSRCGGLIYATALPPAVLGAIDAALELVPCMAAERARLQTMAERFRALLRAADLDTGPSSTQIVPVMLGDERRALEVQRRLEQEGFLGVAIRPPTVPPGTSRIRFALSTLHSAEQVERLAEALVRAAC
jgi:8-amino-7-oxononanoate synthase